MPHKFFSLQALGLTLTILIFTLVAGLSFSTAAEQSQAVSSQSADFDASGDVSILDLLRLKQCIEADCQDPRFDLNQDGQINTEDLLLVREALGRE